MNARRTGERIAGLVYGTIVVMSVIAASSEGLERDPARIAGLVVATNFVFWLAHVYAHSVELSVVRRERLTGRGLKEVAVHEASILTAAVLPTGALLLGVFGLIGERASHLARLGGRDGCPRRTRPRPGTNREAHPVRNGGVGAHERPAGPGDRRARGVHLPLTPIPTSADRALSWAQQRVPGVPHALDALDRERVAGGTLLAGGLAYRLFFWLVPLALVVAAVLSFWEREDPQSLESAGREFGLGASAVRASMETIEQSAHGRWYFLVVGLSLLMWFSIGVVRALRISFAVAWGVRPERMRQPDRRRDNLHPARGRSHRRLRSDASSPRTAGRGGAAADDRARPSCTRRSRSG